MTSNIIWFKCSNCGHEVPIETLDMGPNAITYVLGVLSTLPCVECGALDEGHWRLLRVEKWQNIGGILK